MDVRRDALDRVRSMIDASLDAVIGIDENGRVIEWSRHATTTFGSDRDEVMGRPLADLIIPERYRAAHKAGLERFRATGEGPVLGRRIEMEAIARDGREFPVELSIAAIPTPEGHVFSAFVRDITDRKKAERRRLTLEALNEIAYAAGKPLDPARLAQFIVTYARDLLKAEVGALYWSDPRRGLVPIALGALPYGDLGDAAAQVARRSFDTVWPAVEDGTVAVPLALQGRTVGALAVRLRRDAARGEAAETVSTLEVLASQVAPLIEVAHLHHEIREEQERFGKAFERNPSGLTIARQSDRVIVEANQAFLDMIGYERDEVVGRRATDIGFADPAEMRKVRAELDVSGVVRGKDLVLRAKGGATREVVGSFELADLRGEGVIFGTFLDVTEQRAETRRRAALEERLRLAERLESMGKLAGGIAHDFNNLIGAIMNYAYIVAQDVADRPSVRADVEEIRATAQRASELTRELLVFARREPARAEQTDVAAVVGQMRRLLERTVGEGVDLAITSRSTRSVVRIDPQRLERVILNLAVNARAAMPAGGRLDIATEVVELDAGEAATAAVGPGRYCRVTVRDTGVGMTDETIARLFEPFYTTKPGGHGLGLATVQSIVTDAGGAVTVRSAVGKGTAVSVLLPEIGSAADVQAGVTGSDAAV